MKILITGVAGLIGNHLSRYFLDRGYDVFGIDNLSGGYIDYIDNRLIKNQKFSKCDILNSENINRIFSEFKPDYVYHFAAYAAEGLSPFIRNYNYQNNILASTNIINSCINHNVKKIIFTSSMAVYGEQKPPFIETMIPNPIDPYGIAKYAVEMDLKQAYNQFGLSYSIVRPHNVVGIYQNIWDKYRNVIGIWIKNIINDEPITIYGDGKQKRAFSDIKFYLKPFEQLLDEKYDNEIYNLGSDSEYEIIEVANILKNMYGGEIIYLNKRHEVKHAFSSHEKAKKDLNFIDNTNIEKVIFNMLEWAKKQPNRELKMMNYEITKKMYEYWK